MARPDKDKKETELPDASDRYLSKPLGETVVEEKPGLGAGRVTPEVSGKSIRRTGRGAGFGGPGLIPERLITKPESVVTGGRAFAEEGTPGAVKFDVPYGPPRPDKEAPYVPGIQKHMTILGAGAPTEAVPEPTRRLPMPPRPAVIETTTPKEEAPRGGYAFGRGGGVGVTPTREAPEIERIGKFIDPTQVYTLGGPGGVGKQDVIAGRDWRDLQEEKDLIKGTIAYREPGSKEGARVHRRLGEIAKEQGSIRTGIETGIKGEFEAGTERGKELSSAAAVRDALEEKQRARVAAQEQFDIEEERLATTAGAGVETARIQSRMIYAGARPKPSDEAYIGNPAAYQAAEAEWQKRFKAAPITGGAGAGGTPSGVKVEF